MAQVDTVSLSGTPELGDQYSVTVNGTVFNYVGLGTETGINDVRDALIALINADATVGAAVNATPGTTAGQIVLTAATSGTAFTSSTSATDGNSGQVDTVTLAGTIEAGDRIKVTVNDQTVTYTVTGLEADLDAVRDAVVAAINADANVNTVVTAAPGTDTGAFTMTASAAGASFTATSTTEDSGATLDLTATLATTTTVNAASLENTTENAAFDQQTTGLSHLNFSGDALLPANTTLTMPTMTFTNGGTAAPTFDFSSTTQYSSDELVPLYYTRDGNPGGRLVRLRFDEDGFIYGDMDNSTSRPLYRIPLATFVNPEKLTLADGNVYQENSETGEMSLFNAALDGFAMFVPNALELSNVDLADQFSRMIMTQNAYNSSATAFKTIDEMTETAKDLIS